jgi:acetyltransferase-like isoleucine patch superfamily enzyme
MNPQTTANAQGPPSSRPSAWLSWLWRWEARLKGAEFQGSCIFEGRPLIRKARDARIRIGDGVRILKADFIGLAQPSVLNALVPGASLEIERGVTLCGAVLCVSTVIAIGPGTVLGAGSMVLDNDFHAPAGEWDWSEDFKTHARPIHIGREVVVGAKAIILKGVNIGDAALIEAGAVVTRDVPARHIARGNPAVSEARAANEDRG